MKESQIQRQLTVQLFEAAAFRVGHVARILQAEHPDLEIKEIRPSVYASAFSDEITATAKIDMRAATTDGVHAWAHVLGVEVDVKFHDSVGTSRAFEHHQATATLDDVEVTIYDTRSPSDEEIAAWRTRTVQAGGEEQ